MLQKTFKLFLVAFLFSLTIYSFGMNKGVFAQAPTQEEMQQDLEEARENLEESVEEAREEYEVQIMESTEDSLDSFNEAVDKMQEAQEDVVKKTFLGFALGSGIYIVVAMIIGLLVLGGLVLNIIMIIDCVNRDFKDKNLWLILLIVGTLLGWGLLPGILYYFLVKKKLGPVEKKQDMGDAQMERSQPKQ